MTLLVELLVLLVKLGISIHHCAACGSTKAIDATYFGNFSGAIRYIA